MSFSLLLIFNIAINHLIVDHLLLSNNFIKRLNNESYDAVLHSAQYIAYYLTMMLIGIVFYPILSGWLTLLVYRSIPIFLAWTISIGIVHYFITKIEDKWIFSGKLFNKKYIPILIAINTLLKIKSIFLITSFYRLFV